MESPLLDLAPVGELASRVVWQSRFEDAALAEIGWAPARSGGNGLTVRRDAERGRVVCMPGGRPRRYPILLEARPLARYRVTRVRRSDEPGLDLRVVESSIGLKNPSTVSSAADRQRLLRGTFLEKGATPAVHRFEPGSGPSFPASWERASVDFTTSLDTRTLAILLDRIDARPSSEACFAEIVIELVEATPAQELALLAEAWTRPEGGAEAALPEIGLVKRGSLLPVRRLRATRPPYDENYEHRDALFAPAPTTLRFPVHVPADGRLTFSYALARGSQFGDAVRFEVAVGAEGEWTNVFSEVVTIGEGGEGWHWRQAAVGLERWSGRRVELELRSRFPGDEDSEVAAPEEAAGRRGFALWGNPMVDAPRRPEDPPNVVFIGIDTLRADRLSSYGHDRPTTPHLDRLAAEGIRFDQAISAANWTAPSFASLFTGLPAARHGVTNQELAMSDALVTLAERLRAGGWRTHAVVYKAFLFGLGLDQGFDRWFNLPTSKRTAQVNLDKAFAWLERHHDRRFFLFLHLDDPHQPFNQPAPFDLRFGDAEAHEALGLDLPISITRSSIHGCPGCFDQRRPRPEFVPVAQALYDGAVAYTDDRVGALLERLRDYGIYDDTVIVVVSDHGEVIYDRQGAWGHGATVLTDEMVRVPLILKPARGRPFEPGLVVREQVRSTDLLPTILEAVGLGPAAGSMAGSSAAAEDTPDSRTLWPLIEGPQIEASQIERGGDDERLAFVENPRRGVVGVRTRDWKYIVQTHASGVAQHTLFDLREDPGEIANVAARHPAEVARLGDRLTSFILRTRPGPFLLVLGDGEAGDYRLALETDGDVRVASWIGLPPQTAEGGDRAVAGGGRVLALVELALRPGEAVRASLTSAGRLLTSRRAAGEDFVSYAEGTFERLSALPPPAIYFLHGAPPLDERREAATTTPDQLDDLRALGYIE